MKSNKLSPLVLFVCRFALILGVLIVPWPGWNEMYGQFFRELGQMAFSRDEGNRMVEFSPNDKPTKSASLTSYLTLGNRELLDSTAKGFVKRTLLDTRSIGWVPTALTLALIVATPIPWIRRSWALFGGLFWVHVYILFTIQTWIWNNETVVSLWTLSPWGKELADGLEYTFMEQQGLSFAVPVLIWIFVSFRQTDAVVWNKLFKRQTTARNRSGSMQNSIRRQEASAVSST